MTILEIILVAFVILLNITGIIGAVAPALPGPPLNYAGLLMLHFSDLAEFSNALLFTLLGINIIVFGLDYILPVMGAKAYGASKYGIWGSVIGLIIGTIFFPPFGVIIGAFIGAVAGEVIAGKSNSEAMRAGTATFVASIFMIVIKFSLSAVTFYYCIKGLF